MKRRGWVTVCKGKPTQYLPVATYWGRQLTPFSGFPSTCNFLSNHTLLISTCHADMIKQDHTWFHNRDCPAGSILTARPMIRDEAVIVVTGTANCCIFAFSKSMLPRYSSIESNVLYQNWCIPFHQCKLPSRPDFAQYSCIGVSIIYRSYYDAVL